MISSLFTNYLLLLPTPHPALSAGGLVALQSSRLSPTAYLSKKIYAHAPTPQWTWHHPFRTYPVSCPPVHRDQRPRLPS